MTTLAILLGFQLFGKQKAVPLTPELERDIRAAYRRVFPSYDREWMARVGATPFEIDDPEADRPNLLRQVEFPNIASFQVHRESGRIVSMVATSSSPPYASVKLTDEEFFDRATKTLRATGFVHANRVRWSRDVFLGRPSLDPEFVGTLVWDGCDVQAEKIRVSFQLFGAVNFIYCNAPQRILPSKLRIRPDDAHDRAVRAVWNQHGTRPLNAWGTIKLSLATNPLAKLSDEGQLRYGIAVGDLGSAEPVDFSVSVDPQNGTTAVYKIDPAVVKLYPHLFPTPYQPDWMQEHLTVTTEGRSLFLINPKPSQPSSLKDPKIGKYGSWILPIIIEGARIYLQTPSGWMQYEKSPATVQNR